MHRLSARPLFSVMALASAPHRRWPRGLAGRVFPLLAAPKPPVRCVSRFFHRPWNVATISRVKGPYTRRHNSCANFTIYYQANKYSGITHGMECIETRGTISQVAGDQRSDKDAYRTTSESMYVKRGILGQTVKHTGCEEDQMSAIEDHQEKLVVRDEFGDDNGYTYNKTNAKRNILAESRHRDGSIYRSTMDIWWKKQYRIVDRNETRVEAMMFSDPTNCIIRNGVRMNHDRGHMLQILSLELIELSVDAGSVELYGYIAVRDDLDPLLNYIVNFSRDDPIVVEQGSLINMAGPKRAIDFFDQALIEYDMKIKTGEQEKDDLQLIDGASLIGPPLWGHTFICRIPGDCGTIKLTAASLIDAVEATVEVLISELQKSFDLSVGCLTSDLDEEIRLFNGAIMESNVLERSVVAVMMHYSIDLKFSVGASSSSLEQHFCSFKAKTHGHDAQEIKTDFGLISVKVTWSTMLLGTYADA